VPCQGTDGFLIGCMAWTVLRISRRSLSVRKILSLEMGSEDSASFQPLFQEDLSQSPLLQYVAKIGIVVFILSPTM
jgi:hypothetical protein